MTKSEQCVPGTPRRNTHGACLHPRRLAISFSFLFVWTEQMFFFESSACKHPAAAWSSPLTQCEREELRLRGGRVICLSPLWIRTWPCVGIKGFYMVCKAAFTHLFTPVEVGKERWSAPRTSEKARRRVRVLCISQAGSASRGGGAGMCCFTSDRYTIDIFIACVTPAASPPWHRAVNKSSLLNYGFALRLWADSPYVSGRELNTSSEGRNGKKK